MEIKIGTVGTAGRTVTEKDTALAVKSGSLQVLATPVLSALMEEAAVAALAPCLPPKQTTVGGFIAPSPRLMKTAPSVRRSTPVSLWMKKRS